MSAVDQALKARLGFFDSQFARDRVTFRKQWKVYARNNCNDDAFIEGILFERLETGAPHAFVDFSVYHSTLVDNCRIVSNHHIDNKSTNHRSLQYGSYREMAAIGRTGVKILPKSPTNINAGYFITAFRTEGPTDRLDKTWPIWSGVLYILWSCPQQLRLRCVTLYKRRTHREFYTYVLITECEEALKNKGLTQYFLNMLRLRWCGTVGLYKVATLYGIRK